MTKYTVSKVVATGKTDPTYGDEYIVHFSEDAREVRVSRKKEPLEGDAFYGEILNNKFGAYFKKDPFTPQTENVVVPDSTAPRPAFRDNSDGMRQGMSINNAAKYVIERAVKNDVTLEPIELAAEIAEYAKYIYNIDLNSPAL